VRHERLVVGFSGVVSYRRFDAKLQFARLKGTAMARITRPKKSATDPTKKMTRSDIKQKIRALKKERATAGERAAKSKVEEFNTQLRVYRRMLRRMARRES
jgi:hypothetical protein